MHQRLNSSRIKKSTELARSTGRDLWLSDDHGAYGMGRLVLRISPGGARRFYYRPLRAAGRSKAIPLGLYSRTKQVGHLTLTQARKQASNLAVSLDTRSAVGTAETVRQTWPSPATSQISTQPRPTTMAPSNHSLIQLCRSYARHLKDNNKASARAVELAFERFIAPTELADQPARQISPTAFTDLLRGIISASSGYSASKVRSYVHSAYAYALSARLNPSAPKSQLDYGIESNPIAGIDALAKYKIARTRYLRDDEFRAIWRGLQSTKKFTIPGRGLRLCILLGGQRAEQVVSVKTSQVDLEAGTILLLDGKGNRPIPRQHLLPLPPQALEEVRWLLSYAQSVKSPYLLPSKMPNTAVSAGSISKEVLCIRHKMEADDPHQEHFQFSDFRRTIETKLASLGVSKDYRAQLQSHGLSGVQNKHYDRHDYMREKRDVLILWEKYLSALTDDILSTAS